MYDKFIRCTCFIVCLFCLLFSLFYDKGSEKTEKNDGIDTIEVVKVITDTLVIEKPKLICKYISKIDTVELKVAGDTIYKQVEIPIETIEYKDSSYYAVISGFKASLDTLTIFPRETIIEKKITQYREKKKFGFTVGVGTQYDIINKTPTLGFGLMWGYRF